MCFGQSDVIEALYEDMDRILGRTMEFVDAATALFVLSDHGFCAFRRGVNLNAWLRAEGYLVLLDGKVESGDYFEGIDWARTRAYTFGLSGVYLNLRGREAQGCVGAEEASVLRAELVSRLSGLRDGEVVAIQAVYPAEEIYSGPYLGAAPDLVVGVCGGVSGELGGRRWGGLRRRCLRIT